jgi:quercetin dioxygenase-like cupin family protein
VIRLPYNTSRCRGSALSSFDERSLPMNAGRFWKPVSLVLGLALVVGLEPAIGQQVPTESKGVNVGQTVALDLGQEIDSVKGRQLRLRVVTIEPGGVVAKHTHDGRPGVAYIISGKLTEYREGGSVKEWGPGDAWPEGKDVTHWAENKGAEPLVIIATDVFKPM